MFKSILLVSVVSFSSYAFALNRSVQFTARCAKSGPLQGTIEYQDEVADWMQVWTKMSWSQFCDGRAESALRLSVKGEVHSGVLELKNLRASANSADQCDNQTTFSSMLTDYVRFAGASGTVAGEDTNWPVDLKFQFEVDAQGKFVVLKGSFTDKYEFCSFKVN